jgi:hypothetical protein
MNSIRRNVTNATGCIVSLHPVTASDLPTGWAEKVDYLRITTHRTHVLNIRIQFISILVFGLCFGAEFLRRYRPASGRHVTRNRLPQVFNRSSKVSDRSSKVSDHSSKVFDHSSIVFDHSSNVFNHPSIIFNDSSNVFDHPSIIFNDSLNVFNHSSIVFDDSSIIFNHSSNVFDFSQRFCDFPQRFRDFSSQFRDDLYSTHYGIRRRMLRCRIFRDYLSVCILKWRKRMETKKMIPSKDTDFHILQRRLRTLADANIVPWGLDQDWMTDTFDPAADHWDGKYAAYIDPQTRTPLITAEKTAARKAYEPHVCLLLKGLRYNTRLNEDQRLELGLTDYDASHTPPSALHSWPVAVITPVGPGLLRMDCHDSETGKKAKPYHVHGYEIRKGILPEPPKSVEEIQHSEFATRTPCFLEFDQSLRGQTVYFCLRWEDTRGQKGPWSEILNAIIP